MREVVVTGLGAVSPAGVGVGCLWSRVRDGQAIGDQLSDLDVRGNRSQIGSRLKARTGLPECDEPYIAYAAAAAREAWQDSGLAHSHIFPHRVGVCVGTAWSRWSALTEGL
jgi:3-oxoacyl-(acyl-carrier-protein) synthase